jgi:glycerol-3-phosphate acyltransferase PlsY
MPGSFGNWVGALIVLAACYVVGSIPFGKLIGALRGTDVTRVGSGNIGATNVYRSLGPVWGLLVFVLDFLKGLIPVLIVRSWFQDQAVTICLAATAVIIGHIWSFLLQFKGGKGIATGVGTVMAISPLTGILALVVWAIVVAIYRYVSVGSLVATISVGYWLGIDPDRGGFYVLWALVMALLMAYTHRANISRLATRTEPRVGRP